MKKILLFFMVILLPLNVYAYSDKVIPGGENVGIEIQTQGIVIIGFYKVNGNFNRGKPNLKVGDIIVKVNENKVDNINQLVSTIDEEVLDNKVSLTYLRNKEEYQTDLELIENDGIYKTGLYVKDSLTGIGTITYIDPESLIYGALGHEIIESNSNSKVEVKTGNIFKSKITNIEKSSYGNPGGKKAQFFYNSKYGTVLKNTSYGIYGIYEAKLPKKELISIAKPDEIKKGKAVIYTVLKEELISKHEINITKIDTKNSIKNIYFEINDNSLLEKTGGVVQGMSGSPIIQDGKLIGAVTHVIVEKPEAGYGIFITTMLEEGENN